MEVELIDIYSSENYKISKGTILGVISDDKIKLIDLLTMHKRPARGMIRFNEFEFSKNSPISPIKNKIGIVKNYLEKKFLTNTVLDELKLYSNNDEKKIASSLKMVALDTSINQQNPNSLSSCEKTKLSVVCTLLTNPSLIILDNIFVGMNHVDIKELKKIFNKLKNRYKKTIIIIDNNISLMFDIVDNYLVINKEKIVLTGTKKDFYKEKLYNYCDKPLIIDFINYVNKKGHKIEEYTDLKELIKGIYRDI